MATLKAGTYIIKKDFANASDAVGSPSGLDESKTYTLNKDGTYGDLVAGCYIEYMSDDSIKIGSYDDEEDSGGDFTFSNNGNSPGYYVTIYGEEIAVPEDTTKLRTIIVETDQTVSDEFLMWLNSNIETTARKSIDLTTLSGWSSLAEGDHLVTIKAKGYGYRDSEASTEVKVTKSSSTKLIQFTLYGDGTYNVDTGTTDIETYQAEEGMTWEQWMNSSYNTGNFVLGRYGISKRKDSYYFIALRSDSDEVALTDTIIAGKQYYFGAGQ